MKKINLEKKHFLFFKKKVEKYLKDFGLDEYQVEISHKDSYDGFSNAYNSCDWENGIASIYLLMKDYEPICDSLEKDLELSARHEVIHLLTGELYELAQWRYPSKFMISHANEKLVRRLEKLL